jgi:peptide deformylase
MAILKIARMGHPVLTRKADPVPDPSAPEIRRLVADMAETLADAQGIGLAAPQVHVPLRLFVWRGGAGNVIALVNPEVEPVGEEVEEGWEGCLSLPDLRGVVPRAARIRFRGVDIEGRPIDGEAAGLPARVIQHEYDHLNGVLYLARMTDFTKFGYRLELEQVGQVTRAGEAPKP